MFTLRSPSIAAAFVAITLSLTPSAWAKSDLSAIDLATYSAAFEAADNDQWSSARSLVRKASDPLLADVIWWRHLRVNGGKDDPGTKERVAFLDRHPDWPLTNTIQRILENDLLDRQPGANEAITFFEHHPPVSSKGKLVLARAFMDKGAMDKARALARDAWINGDFSQKDETDALARFRILLTADDHWARADRLVWDDQYAAANRMLRLLDKGHASLISARIVLGSGKGNADAAVAAVPKNLRSDPGLVYERVRWRRKAGLEAAAANLLLKEKGTARGREDKWWRERALLIRDAMDHHHYSQAYKLASSHEHDQGLAFAEGEWLSGWIALRFLKNPTKAYPHFTSLHDGVSTPISLSRGAYWSGRAAEALKKAKEAKAWYEKAALYPATFYGQLAAEKLGKSLSTLIPSHDPAPDDKALAILKTDPMVTIARQLAELGREDELMSFILTLNGKYTDLGSRASIAAIALDNGQLGVGVFMARRASLDGSLLTEGGYPLPPGLTERVVDHANRQHLHPAAVLGLARQESNFNPKAKSRVGALGLMQLMPATARKVSGQEGIPFDQDKLTSDPAYNVRLGSRYFGDLMKQFGGSIVLSAAGYNAGPGRPIGWMKDNGDPRSMSLENAIDWIEKIPYPETRNYVQRVIEGMLVYQVRLGETLPVNAPSAAVKG
ncbi:lytic transglycosylase domain-containing protein [Rhodospirillum sp. A1_3_36]|uniref:lytic transglycosylase domain-containing protein n=1 Tax=Rhodospirillum sp. A1_3_36 TaxID=3391666 RepID=UPI0039A43A43